MMAAGAARGAAKLGLQHELNPTASDHRASTSKRPRCVLFRSWAVYAVSCGVTTAVQ